MSWFRAAMNGCNSRGDADVSIGDRSSSRRASSCCLSSASGRNARLTTTTVTIDTTITSKVCRTSVPSRMLRATLVRFSIGSAIWMSALPLSDPDTTG